jgi:hypothetical protein
MKKVTLKKGFIHDGRAYQAGEEFEGMPDEIDDLVRQGYADAPAPEAAAEETQ